MTTAVRKPLFSVLPFLWVVGFLLAVSFTFTVRDYGLFQLSRVACLAIATLSLNMLIGHGGQISVGQGALFGLGAYTTVLLVYHDVISYPLAVLAGTLLCFCVGTIIGLPALRLRGLSLGLVTLGAAVVFPELLKHYSTLTGGVFGISMSPPTAPGADALTSSQWMWLVSLLGLATMPVI